MFDVSSESQSWLTLINFVGLTNLHPRDSVTLLLSYRRDKYIVLQRE